MAVLMTLGDEGDGNDGLFGELAVLSEEDPRNYIIKSSRQQRADAQQQREPTSHGSGCGSGRHRFCGSPL